MEDIVTEDTLEAIIMAFIIITTIVAGEAQLALLHKRQLICWQPALCHPRSSTASTPSLAIKCLLEPNQRQTHPSLCRTSCSRTS